MRMRNPFVPPRRQQSAPSAPETPTPSVSLIPAWTPSTATAWSTTRAITDGLASSTWVYVACRRIATAAASAVWHAERVLPDGTRERLPDHPLAALLRDPEPGLNGQDWFELMVMTLELGGNAIAQIVTRGSRPVALHPLPPDAVAPQTDATGRLTGYRVRTSPTSTTTLQPADVLHFRFLNPASPFWGLSPLQAAARVVDTDLAAVRWNQVAMENRAVSDGIFKVSAPLSRDEWEALREEIRAQQQGVDNAHTPWVVGYGADWQDRAKSPVEMDFLNTRRFSRNEILAAFGVPPPMAGILEDASDNDVRTARSVFWLDTIIPLLDDLRAALQSTLVARYGEPDLVIDYDLSDLPAVQQLMLDRVDAARTLWEMGTPLNEAARLTQIRLDPDTPGADRAWLPANRVPVTSPAPPTTQMDDLSRLIRADDPPAALAWQQAVAATDPWIARLTTLAAGWLDTDRALATAAAAAGGTSALERLRLPLTATWTARLEPTLQEMGAEIAARSLAEFAVPEPPDTTATARAIAREQARLITDATINAAQDAVAEQARSAVGRQALNPRAFLADIEGRARAIATTVTQTVYTRVRQLVAVASGQRLIRQWVTQQDGQVCPDCAAMAGQTVRLDDVFTGGDPPRHPHCRCVILYATERRAGFDPGREEVTYDEPAHAGS